MHVLLINPNTTEEFTRRVEAIARKFASPATQVTAVTPAYGPRSIESIYDELLSSAGTLEIALQHLDQVDGIIIACYSDHPTVYALREITDKPVLGIAEASMLAACMLGQKFSVVTTNREWEPLLWDAARHYGLGERVASIRSTGMAVLALEQASPEETFAMIGAAARKAVEEDGAEVICLGCAGMSGFDKTLEQELGVPVIDGVVAALKFLEGLHGYGLRTSKTKTYSVPGRKELVGLPEIFNRAYRSEGA